MKNITLIFSLLFIFLFCSELSAQIIRGNGAVRNDIRDLTGYNEIVAQGKFTLILTQGEKEGVRIETDENIIELFQTRVDKKKLYITMLANIRKSEGLNVFVSIKELTSLILLDEIVLKSETVIHFDELSIFSGGMSQLNIELFAATLDVELTDGTYAYLEGYTETLIAEIHDETELNALGLQTDFCNIKSTGLTEVMIDVQKELNLLVTGGSNLYYSGEPVIGQRIFSSSGFIVKRKRKIPNE
ncbi:MAG: DUF2807 domain-containing protein [Salinivirgaceae bacterium]|jgi:hypothetical protein|nr:DUF2807 domain-containing protein [Salinivirgaceae bacterium]